MAGAGSRTEMTYLIRARPEEAKERILATLAASAGSNVLAAQHFQVDASTLRRWIHKLGLEDRVNEMRTKGEFGTPEQPTPEAPAEKAEAWIAQTFSEAELERRRLKPLRTDRTVKIDEVSEAMMRELLASGFGYGDEQEVIRCALRELLRREGMLSDFARGRVAGKWEEKQKP